MATIKNTITLQDKMTPTLRGIIKALDSTVMAMAGVDRVSNSSFNKMKRDVENAKKAVDNFSNGVDEVPKSFSKISNPLVNMSAAFYSAKQIIAGIGNITGLADQVSMTTSRLNLMNDGAQTTDVLQKKILNTANASRSSYMDTAAVVSKLGILAGDSFKNNDEMLMFAEQMNKQFKIGGSSVQEQSSAMYQLTQAMASGALQGDEFRAIRENAPLLAKAIADYTGKSIGDLKEMGAQGLITSDVIKGAMFASMNETNERFKTLPMTFGQSMTIISNNIITTIQPVLTWLSQGAQWIATNWNVIAPILAGVGAGAITLAIGLGIAALATWIANGAAATFFATLLANPLTWIVLVIGSIVMMIYKWVQSVGGIKVAWAMVVNWLLIAWDWVKIAFFTGVYYVMGLWDKLGYGLSSMGVAIANTLGDLKANVLMTLQNLVNGAIGIINKFIGILNKIPGVSIEAVSEVTFGATAQIENEANKRARNSELAAKKAKMEASQAERDANIASMKAKASADRSAREKNIASMQAEAKAKSVAGAGGAGGASGAVGAGAGSIDKVGKVGSVGKIEDDVSISDEDIKLLKDVATAEFINKYTTLRPEMKVTFGDIRESADVGQIMTVIEDMVEEAYASSLVNG